MTAVVTLASMRALLRQGAAVDRCAVLLLAAAVALLFLVVFPAVEPLLPLGDVTVDDSAPSPSSSPSS